MFDYDTEYLLAGSEDLSREFNDLASAVSDLYKDCHGIRPRFLGPMCACDFANEAELRDARDAMQKTYDSLCVESIAIFENERIQEQARVAHFESAIEQYLAYGAFGRETALRWMAQGLGIEWNGTKWANEELEYHFGLPYGYLSRVA